jgi:hypothetical protein
MLTFNSLALDSFRFSNDFQKLDSLWSVNLSDNKITKVNVPDSLQFSKNLYIQLDRNLLPEFPISILKIKGTTNISVQYNKIASLPREIIHSGIPSIYLDHNKLCSLTDSSVINWLDTVYGNWQSRQDCP